MTNKIDRTHGSTGTKPPDGDDFQSGERPDPEEFDWFWYTVTEKINSIVGDISDIVSGTTQVGSASAADTASNVSSTYKGNDIDTDGDGVVNEAQLSQETKKLEVRTDDPTNPNDGQVWIRSDL